MTKDKLKGQGCEIRHSVSCQIRHAVPYLATTKIHCGKKQIRIHLICQESFQTVY